MDENNRADGMPPTIGRYKVLEGIGFGAMGAVYKAFDPLIKRTLAIKTIRLDIPRQSPQYKSFIERFYHEARISGTLSHPNIVTLFDIGEEAGVPYLAMEFVEGETIASIVERGVRFKPEKVVGLVSQIAAALDYAHSRGVIHRDVKPANLMLYEGDRVKVTDFGIAKLVDAEMTQSGTLLGTPSYMSPEQAMGDKLDGRSDIFSLGVCAFEMLSGEQPFPGTNVTSILYKLVHVDPVEPPNLEMNGLVPQKWHEVFGKVLAKKPDDRYQDAGAFVRDLEYCLGSWFGALGNEQTIVAAPPPSEDESPATVLMKAPPRVAPPPAPAPVDDSGTVMLKAPLDDTGTVPLKAPLLDDSPVTVMLKAPLALPASDEDDSPATVMLKAPPAPPADDDSPATVMLKAPPVPQARRPAAAPPPEESDPATVMLKVPSARPAAPPPVPAEEEDSATVVLSGLPDPDEEPVTVLLKSPPDTRTAPGPVRAQPPPKVRPPAPRAKAADPAPPEGPGSITDKVPVTVIIAAPVAVGVPPAGPSSPSTPRKPAVSPLLLLGGAAVLFLGAAAVVVWLMFGRTSPVDPTAEPTSTLVATVTPPPDAPPPVPVEPVGLIHVETQPPGAAVNVNGETRGATPLDLTGLAFGAYDIKLELKGYDPRTQKVEVTEQAPRADVNVALSRQAPVEGTADILSTPFGAAITVDGASVGVTPLTDLKLKPGSRKVELTKEGFEPWTGVVTVQGGKRAKLDAQLKTVVKATPTPGPTPEVLDANKVYLPSEVDTPPKKVSGMSPSYPEKTAPKLKSGQSVSVVVTWVVSESGEVSDITVVQSASKVVDDAVTGAIANYKYQPALKRGVKVKVKLTLKQTFQSG